MNAIPVASAVLAVVSFKDADKIKSWDAWDDHKAQVAITNVLQKEKRCVTWEKLNALNPGLKEIGRLATRTSDQVKSSDWSVGCETLDRDYADWDSYKALIPMLGECQFRHFVGETPVLDLKNRSKAAADSYPTRRAMVAVGSRRWRKSRQADSNRTSVIASRTDFPVALWK